MTEPNNNNAIVLDGEIYTLRKVGVNKPCNGWCALHERCELEWARKGHQPCLVFDPSGQSVLMYACSTKDLCEK